METTMANPVPAMPTLMVEQGAAVTMQTTPSYEGRLLTVDEIAVYLQVKPKTIYNWVSLGVMPCIRMNKRIVRFKLEKVMKWIAGYEQKGRRTYKMSWDKYLAGLER